MANRYWRGRSGTWDASSTANWSATSGGAGGASAPTTADDVFFDANSNGATTFRVTIAAGAAAKSINCTGFTRAISGTGAITVAGSVTLVTGMTYTHTGIMTFTGTGTLTTAGNTFSEVVVDGVGITLTLGDALNTSNRNITVTNGSFNTSNYNVTAGAIFSANSNVRTISFGSSTITLSGTTALDFVTATNLTLNAGTSLINATAATTTIRCGGLTLYNFSFTGTAIGTRSIVGATTFNNLTLNSSAPGLTQLTLSADQTITSAFTCTGSTPIARGFILSNSAGTTRTITAASISVNDCDFRDITIAGAAAGSSPTRAGNCGGNSGVVFPAAKTVYRVGTDNTWAGSASWALTSGGTGSDNNFPLPQDTAVIDNNTALTNPFTISSYNISSINASNRTKSLQLEQTSATTYYGSYTLGSGISLSTTTTAQTFSGRGTMVFTSAGKTIAFPITIDAIGGTFKLGDSCTMTDRALILTRGTFDADIYNLTAFSFASSNSNTRAINMGSGIWSMSGSSTVWNIATTTGLTFNKGTSNILLSGSTAGTRTFAGGGLSYNKLTIGGNPTATAITQITGTNTFTEMASVSTGPVAVRFTATGFTVDTWSISGTATDMIAIQSSVSGAQRNFNLTNVTSGINYLSVKDIAVNQTNRFYVGPNSTDGGNNLNVYFTNPPTVSSTGKFFQLF